jgi:formamidopyrimidine-DNA glycosylase
MPELPEVETLLRQLSARITGSVISRVNICDPRILKGSCPKLSSRFENQPLERVFRRGKYLCLETRGCHQLWIHLGMTGRLYFSANSDWPHTHLELVFKNQPDHLFFRDPRRFGRVIFVSADDGFKTLPEGIRLTAPDPLEMPAGEFVQRLRERTGAIKALLLNQRLVSGIGNIYADESLFRAGISPRKKASALGRARLERLHGHIREVLEEAIQLGGSTIDDYRQLAGQEGSFQNRHRVYGKTGEACPVCSRAIRVIRLGGRSSHYCPGCQK